MDTDPQTDKVATPDGRPTPLAALNTGVPDTLGEAEPGLLKRLARLYHKINLFVAGMYTGVGCSGTPHTHHTYSKSPDASPAKQPNSQE